MMVYVSGINERFNSDIVKTHNKNQYIYQRTYSIKDSVHVSSIIPMMDKTQVNSDCEFYDIYRLLIFLTKCGPYDAMAPSQNY